MNVRFEDQLELAAVATAVSCARAFVRATLRGRGASHVLDDALIVASELVTSAVKATGITEPSPAWSALASLSLLTVRLVGLDASLVIEVRDASPEDLAARQVSADEEHGRGLSVVEQLASSSGSYPYQWYGQNCPPALRRQKAKARIPGR
jgi:anti-sigma regulatory factor (Ser/Thr protein kinase)